MYAVFADLSERFDVFVFSDTTRSLSSESTAWFGNGGDLAIRSVLFLALGFLPASYL